MIMVWNYFIYIGIASVVLWFIGAWMAWKDKEKAAITLTMAGFVLMTIYVGCLWGELDRPPMRTMGETRLWYSLLLPLAGVFVYVRWKYKWILSFTSILATVFVFINIFKPEIHSKNLMPALQSPWFAPHVIVYMLAYAMMGAAFVVALYLLFFKKSQESDNSKEILMIDNMVIVSYAFLTLGMLMGALWAKTAWGHYWSWDPKETWAAITWFSYLAYIHYRLSKTARKRTALWMVIATFCLLQMCWWGVNYLPSAQGASIHTYSMQ
jgi:ABC-type transport system involved in cytochrome c biogenesis permease subunit